MFNDKLFEYLVATDQLDEFLGHEEENNEVENELAEEEDKNDK